MEELRGRGCLSKGWVFSSDEVVEAGAQEVEVEGESIVSSVGWAGFEWVLGRGRDCASGFVELV